MSLSVDILIPVFQGKRFLRETVESALTQKNVESNLILIDDGDPDASVEVVVDHSIEIVRHAKNLGVAAALNSGLTRSESEFVAVLDQDDLLAPGALERSLEYLRSNDSELAVMGRLTGFVNAMGEPVEFLSANVRARQELLGRRITKNYMINGGWLPPSPLSQMVFRREIFDRVGAFDTRLKLAHDRDWLYRALGLFYIPRIQSDHLSYRLHANNHSVHFDGKQMTPHRRTVAEYALLEIAHGIQRSTK